MKYLCLLAALLILPALTGCWRPANARDDDRDGQLKAERVQRDSALDALSRAI